MVAYRRMTFAFCATCALFNSFPVHHFVWVHTVMMPSIHVVHFLKPAFEAFELGAEAEGVVLTVVSRLVFVVWVLLIYVLQTLLKVIAQKYLKVAPQRWWQLRLSGLLILMTVFGVGAGMLIRLLMR